MTALKVPKEAAPLESARKFKRLSTAARVGQVGGSLVAMIAAYWTYSLIAVPLIEPGLEDQKPTARVSDREIGAARQAIDSRQRELAQYFPEGSWEREQHAAWKSEQSGTRLLFQTLTPEKGGVLLKPCTVMFFPKSDRNDPNSKPIIMRALQGAHVQFDKPIDLATVNLNERELVGGRLTGPIRIYRELSRPDAADDLEIAAHDVEMEKDRVWTPYAVQFRMGRNHGSGRHMEIRLASPEGGKPKGFRAGTVRTLELQHDVRMQLDMAGAPKPGEAKPNSPGKPAKAEPPLEITCQGSFLFDVQQYSASFFKQVDVVRLYSDGASDQLNCEALSVYFTQRRGNLPGQASSTPPAADSAKSPGTPIRLIEARGDPVTLRSPSQGFEARCRGFDFAPDSSGSIGRLKAFGPGTLQGRMPKDPNGKFDARWTDELRFEPEGTQHVAILRGGAVIRLPEMGQITADEVMAWLSQQTVPAAAVPAPQTTATIRPVSTGSAAGPAAAASPAQPGPTKKWQLEHVLAQRFTDPAAKSQGPVVIDAPQLLGTTSRLEAWVDRPQAASTDAAPGNAAPTGPAQEPRPKRPKDRSTKQPTQRFDVRGGTIQIHLLPDGEQLALSTVTLEGQAHLHEMTTPRAGEKPMLVEGHQVHVAGVDREQTRVTIRGNPGYIEAGGITLTGGAIEMEKETKHLWVEGPGRMTMPMEQDFNGKKLTQPTVIDITWKNRMDFQTDTVVYQGTVVAKSAEQFVRSDNLEAVLTKPIDFASAQTPATAARPQDRPQLARIRTYGKNPTFLEARQYDPTGRPQSLDQLEAVELSLDRLSGAIFARGPGWVTHVALGTGSPMAGAAGAHKADSPTTASTKPPAKPRWTYLNVRFEDAIDGNLYKRQMHFGDRTTTVYGPVDNWQATLSADDPANLGPEGFVLGAKELFVREIPARVKRDRGFFELEAVGNVVGEGSGFTARGHTLNYSEEKDLIVLRGDQLSDAEIFRDDPKGGPRQESKNKELKYWLGLHRGQVTGVQSIEIAVPREQKKESKPNPGVK